MFFKEVKPSYMYMCIWKYMHEIINPCNTVLQRKQLVFGETLILVDKNLKLDPYN